MSKLPILSAEFDLLWKKIEYYDLESEFCKFLENDYNLFDIDRARDIIAEGP